MVDTKRNGSRLRLADVAAAGLSATQVSHALSGRSDVAAATRERVIRLAAELGYHPSERGRALRQGRGALRRCAVVLLGRSAEVFGRSGTDAPVLAGILAQAPDEGLDTVLVPLPIDGTVTTDEERDRWGASALSRLVAQDRADGFIILAFTSISAHMFAPLDEAGVPYVLAHRHPGERPAKAVTVDYEAAMAEAVDRLVALGHRRMAAILSGGVGSSVTDRERGWRDATARHGIAECDSPIIRCAEPRAASARRAADDLLAAVGLAGGTRPTAIVCHTDLYAHAVLQAAVAAGVRVPEELSVIGVGDAIARFLTPALCTFDCNLHDVGVRAASVLGAALRVGDLAPVREMVRARFVCRASCARAPAA